MKKTRMLKFLQVFNAIALAAVIQSANSACIFYYHQPAFPKAADKYRKL